MMRPPSQLLLLFLFPFSVLSEDLVKCLNPTDITPDYGFGVRKDKNNLIPTDEPGSTYSFFCLPSFDLVPADPSQHVRTCQDDGTWSGPSLKCVPKTGVGCEEPSFPDHVITTTPLLNTFPIFRVLELGCEAGWVGRGNVTAQCDPYKRWVVDYECKPGCPDPNLPENSFIRETALAVDEAVTARCNVGYKLLGVPEISCAQDKTWTIQFGCCFDSSDGNEGQHDAQKLYRDNPEYFYGPIIAALVLFNVMLIGRLFQLRKSQCKIVSTDMVIVKPAKNFKTEHPRAVALTLPEVTTPYRKIDRELSF